MTFNEALRKLGNAVSKALNTTVKSNNTTEPISYAKPSHWRVWYRDCDDQLKCYDAPEHIRSKDVAMIMCKAEMLPFKDFERDKDGQPVVRKVWRTNNDIAGK